MMVPRILAILSSSDIVIDVEIIEMILEPNTQYLRAKAKLRKGYVLYVTEGIGESYRRYSYHLKRDNEMIKRWDNAPHWKSIKTFPFHVHLAGNDKPQASMEVFVDDVLLELRELIGEEND
jgi:hypothetical protein